MFFKQIWDDWDDWLEKVEDVFILNHLADNHEAEDGGRINSEIDENVRCLWDATTFW